MKKLLFAFFVPLFFVACENDDEKFTKYSFIGSWTSANDTSMYLIEFRERGATISYASLNRNEVSEASWYANENYLFIYEFQGWMSYRPHVRIVGFEGNKYRATMYLEGDKGRLRGRYFEGWLIDPYRKRSYF